jgi:hypothetical protein
MAVLTVLPMPENRSTTGKKSVGAKDSGLEGVGIRVGVGILEVIGLSGGRKRTKRRHLREQTASKQ